MSPADNNTLFFLIKILHIVSALCLWTSLWIATIYRPQSTLTTLTQYAEGVLVALAMFVQPLLGFTLINLKPYAPTPTWWPMVLLGNGILGIAGLCMIYCRQQKYYRYRLLAVIVAWLMMILLIYLMTRASYFLT